MCCQVIFAMAARQRLWKYLRSLQRTFSWRGYSKTSLFWYEAHIITDIFHLKCLNDFCRQLPEDTASAGYSCPSCKVAIFPSDNVSSKLASLVRETLKSSDWVKHLFIENSSTSESSAPIQIEATLKSDLTIQSSASQNSSNVDVSQVILNINTPPSPSTNKKFPRPLFLDEKSRLLEGDSRNSNGTISKLSRIQENMKFSLL